LSSVYSTRLLATHDQPGITPAVYVVPAGFTLVVVCIDAYFGSALSDRTCFAIGSAGQVFWSESVGPGLAGWRQWTGREVFYAGEDLQLFASDTWDLSASGYLLELP
jgi:hypothetical protein